MRALLSVYDKEGLVELAQGLSDLGWELVASGNTAATLSEAGIAHIEVAEVTGSPEMLGGRVKTLHPKIHGGILADRSKPEHLADLEANGIDAIDLVVSNLYPFSSDPSIELIDIGGPAMVRAAAKNHEHVGIVTSPADYPVVLDELRRRARCRPPPAAGWPGPPSPTPRPTTPPSWPGSTPAGPHRRTASRAPRTPTREEAALARRAAADAAPDARAHRGPALRREPAPARLALPHRRDGELVGRRWSSTAATRCRTSTSSTATPPGAWSTSWPPTPAPARRRWPSSSTPTPAAPPWRATWSPPTSARSSATSRAPSGAWSPSGATSTRRWPRPSPPARRPTSIIASSYAPEALEKLTGRRKATRLLSGPAPEQAVRQLRSLGASVLVQDVDAFVSPRSEWRVVTTRQPTDDEWRDLVLAWRVCGRTTSNAIAVVTNGQAVGRRCRAAVPGGRGRDRRAEGGGAGQGRRRGERRLLPLPRRAARAGRRRRDGGGPAGRLGEGRRGHRRRRRGRAWPWS